MTGTTFKLPVFMAFAMLVSLVGCGGGADSPGPPAADAVKLPMSARTASSSDLHHRPNRFGRGARQTLLVGTSDQTIVQLDPGSGRVLATLKVDTVPRHIVADDSSIYFGGWPLGRYDPATQQQLSFAASDAFTGAAGLAIAPSGTVFASNLYHVMPDTSCGTCSTVMAYPDPSGANPEGRLFFAFGYVRELADGEGRLSGQQLGFTDDARLLVTSKAGDGVFVSDAPLAEVCCAPAFIAFKPLVADDSRSTLRFARRGTGRLLVLHDTGRIDEHALDTGRLVRPVLQAGTVDPLDMVVSDRGSIHVLEKSGQIRSFSARGRESARITLPADAGQAVSLALCCDAGPGRRHRR